MLSLGGAAAANDSGVPEKWQHILRRNEVFQEAAAREREREEREAARKKRKT